VAIQYEFISEEYEKPHLPIIGQRQPFCCLFSYNEIASSGEIPVIRLLLWEYWWQPFLQGVFKNNEVIIRRGREERSFRAALCVYLLFFPLAVNVTVKGHLNPAVHSIMNCWLR